MACRSKTLRTTVGTWRAYLDDELPLDERNELQEHLATCASCQAALADVRSRAGQVSQTIETEKRDIDVNAQVERFWARTSKQEIGGWTTMRNATRQIWRPAVAIIMTVSLLVGVYSFAPTRALAREFLSIFRAESLAVVKIDADSEQMEAAAEQIGVLLEGIEPTQIMDEPAQEVNSIEEASLVAGFKVRIPSYLPESHLSTIHIKGDSKAVFDVTKEVLEQFLALAGMDPNQLPEGFEQGEASIHMPGTVSLQGPGWTLTQVLSPEVTYPSELDPQLLGQAGFRLLGMSEKDAKRISQEIDWATTLVLPMPKDLTELREVQVAGETAILVSPRRTDDDYRRVLLWEKDGIVNMLSYSATAERLLKIAESMY